MLSVSKICLSLIFLPVITLAGDNCNKHDKPELYKETPTLFKQLLRDNGISLDGKEIGLPLFKDFTRWKNSGFVLDSAYREYLIKPNSIVKNPGENTWFSYPILDGVFHISSYKGKFEYINIAKILDSKYLIDDVANAIIKKYGLFRLYNYGSMYDSHGSAVKLKVNGIYYQVAISINGYKEEPDSFKSRSNKTSITYSIINNTDVVEEYIECKKKYLSDKKRGKNIKL